MTFFAPERIADAMRGRWLRPPASPVTLEGVGTDTREPLAGKAFVALRGACHDGHDHLGDAAAAGAGLLVVEQAPADEPPAGPAVLLVDDTRAALGALAAAYRDELAATVIAVTGSCGKTTVKTMIDAVCATGLRGRAAPRSFNNEVGLPLAILAARRDDQYLVLEVGSNRPGEIDALARIARPDVGVITMIGRAHLEGFGSLEAVAREKASLLEHLVGPRAAVINVDGPMIETGRAEAVVRFGESPDADLRLARRGGEAGRWWFEIAGQWRFRLGLPGRHNAVNALAAVAVGRGMGLGDDAIDAALATLQPVEMRLSRHRVGDVTIYNDAYNANPDSVRASLESFADLAAGAARRVVVLGDMLELGESGPQQHREVGERILELDRRRPIDRVVLVGPLSTYTAEPISGSLSEERVMVLQDMGGPNAAAVAATIRPGDAVLIKGSRGLALERLIEAIAT